MRYQFAADVNAYIEHLRPHVKESTVKDKERKLRLICKIFTTLYQEGKVSSNNPRRIGQDDLIIYIGYRRSMGISDSTISKDLSQLNQLFIWVGNNEIETFRAFGGVYRPHAYTGRKRPMPNDLIDRVYELARETDSWDILRGCMAVILCCSCGLRPQEARQLYADDIVFMGDRSVVHVEHVKGEGTWGEPRNVMIMDGVEDIFRKYLGMRAEMLEKYGRKSRAMFPPLRGDSEFYCQQSFGRLKKVVEDILGTKFELRSGRRAYGQRLIDKGNPIEDVSVAMGHASTKTTEGFYARSREDIVMNRILSRERGQEVS
ncbi:MAG: tyrosine-type recombinase/integrase [Candidatus Methanomethylophilaceae archaeon]